MRAAPGRSGGFVALLLSQLLSGLGVASGIAVGGLLTERISGQVALAGFAQTSSVLGAGLAAIPLARLAASHGRRAGLALGYGLAAVGGGGVVLAAVTGQVVIMFAACLLFGAATASGLQARFAAADVAAPAFRARALSVIMWVGTLGSVAGPNLSTAGGRLGTAVGLEPLAGPYLISIVAFAASAIVIVLGVRPPAADAPVHRPTLRAAFAAAWSTPVTRLAIVAIACSHTIMVGVMVMTPLHLHAHAFGLDLIGIVLGIHILGMYGASPIMGWIADRQSPRTLLHLAVVIFVAALILAALVGGTPAGSMIALGLLGLGWSAGMIGGSTLLTDALDPSTRIAVQGASDAIMNLSAAASAALSGLVLAGLGYPGLAVVAGVVLVPMIVLLIGNRHSPVRAAAASDQPG